MIRISGARWRNSTCSPRNMEVSVHWVTVRCLNVKQMNTFIMQMILYLDLDVKR